MPNRIKPRLSASKELEGQAILADILRNYESIPRMPPAQPLTPAQKEANSQMLPEELNELFRKNREKYPPPRR